MKSNSNGSICRIKNPPFLSRLMASRATRGRSIWKASGFVRSANPQTRYSCSCIPPPPCSFCRCRVPRRSSALTYCAPAAAISETIRRPSWKKYCSTWVLISGTRARCGATPTLFWSAGAGVVRWHFSISRRPSGRRSHTRPPGFSSRPHFARTLTA